LILINARFENAAQHKLILNRHARASARVAGRGDIHPLEAQ